jgi:hypothetical protein
MPRVHKLMDLNSNDGPQQTNHNIQAHTPLSRSSVPVSLPHATVSVKLGQSAAGVCTLREWLWAQ